MEEGECGKNWNKDSVYGLGGGLKALTSASPNRLLTLSELSHIKYEGFGPFWWFHAVFNPWPYLFILKMTKSEKNPRYIALWKLTILPLYYGSIKMSMPSIYLPLIHLSIIYLSIISLSSISLSSIYPSIYPSIHPSIHLSILYLVWCRI